MPRPAGARTSSTLLSVAALAVIWSAAWWGACALAEREIDEWLSREAADGRQWTCPERVLEGFPFALTLRCVRPTFRGEMAGHDTDGVVERLEATVGLAHPTALAVTLHGPLTLRARDDAFLLALSWDSLAIAAPLRLGPPAEVEVAAARLAVSGSAPGRGELNVRAAALGGSVASADGAPADRRFAVTVTGVTFPTLDALPGLDAGLAEVAASGVLAGASLLTAPTVARLETWRQAGGELRLESLRFGKGTFSGTASGRLALDAAHRPAGALDLALLGFEPLARQLGIPVAGVQLGGLLASVLGGKPPAPAPRGAVRLPLTLADGALQLGPFPLGVRLLPLY